MAYNRQYYLNRTQGTTCK